jgi:hypothetical protein
VKKGRARCFSKSLAAAITLFLSTTKAVCSHGAAAPMGNWVMGIWMLDTSLRELLRWQVLELNFYLLQLLVAATCAAVTNHCTGVLITLAAGGTHHSAAVTDGGLVYTWGCASSGNWHITFQKRILAKHVKKNRHRSTWTPYPFCHP